MACWKSCPGPEPWWLARRIPPLANAPACWKTRWSNSWWRPRSWALDCRRWPPPWRNTGSAWTRRMEPKPFPPAKEAGEKHELRDSHVCSLEEVSPHRGSRWSLHGCARWQHLRPGGAERRGQDHHYQSAHEHLRADRRPFGGPGCGFPPPDTAPTGADRLRLREPGDARLDDGWLLPRLLQQLLP